MSYLKVAKDIKNLKIQGATNVALSALKSLENLSLTDFKKASKLFFNLRATEPLLRNGLKYVSFKVDDGFSVDEAVSSFEKMINDSFEKTVEVGIRKIKRNSIVMTHCHSSVVVEIIKRAFDKGKVEKVFSSETRPLFQGRITAKQLAGYGVPVVSYVDSAMRHFVNDADLVLVGADAITSDGFLVNKIGTSLLALAADEARTSFGSAFEIFKFDPSTIEGYNEGIEQRNKKEVWNTRIENVEVVNPAFDFTPHDYVNFVITNKGVFSIENVPNLIEENYGWLFNDFKY